jgi:hypothetical protein
MLKRECPSCFELLNTSDALIPEVRQLYELTQAPEERIPWEWLQGSIERRQNWRPGRWCPHLLVTAAGGAEGLGALTGFIYGGHIPSFGGYVCYLGVDPKARKQGAGTRLYEQFFHVLAVDAAAEGKPLPFVVWESHRPTEDAPESAWDIWTARLKLFARVGAWWIDGIEFQSPNYGEEEEPAIPLQLFVKPIDEPVESFNAERLKGIAAGLHQYIYRHGPDHPLVRATQPPGCVPRLRPPTAAERPTMMV